MDFATLPTLPEAQIIQRYEVHRYFDWMRTPRYKPSSKSWCVAEGDLAIDGHLRLAWETLPCAGLLVTGSLTVDGAAGATATTIRAGRNTTRCIRPTIAAGRNSSIRR
jgi:hypothetical protein